MNFWTLAYNNSWATKEDMQRAVQIGEITEDEFEEIVKEAYEVD
ncbi:XkdX family protein [Evansella halocellulosilytica]|nr:XkdX family protein [Evansella halocellulosilytica]